MNQEDMWVFLPYWNSPLWTNSKGQPVDVRKISPQYASNIENFIERYFQKRYGTSGPTIFEEVKQSMFWKFLDKQARSEQ